MAPEPSSTPNRLANETSPYLLQHASNPVDWFAWGEEALERARELDRPIFLSIGYSACHWCHVMEHESFEDPEIAGIMNERFVNIKVDREERPDLDQIYMNAVQLMTGRGGWPMSVFLTPDLKPFYGGTYWPPTSRMGMPGFRDVLLKLSEVWQDRREEAITGAESLTDALIRMSTPDGEKHAIDESVLRNATQALLRIADRTYGGFGGAPKFPHPMDVRLLFRAARRFQNEEAQQTALFTLDKMAGGGIYDHLGGGFHRYSTDARWLAPHFEKMLYDNGLLASTYLEAYQLTANEDYARVVRETLDYVLREMTQPEGGFYSTQDADSEGVEGKFFVWSEAEIVEILGTEDAVPFNYCYDVSAGGNWEGANILNRPKTTAQAAAMLRIDEGELNGLLARCREKLFEVRSKRIAPARDDKVIVSWNGLMISAMARAAQVLDEPRYGRAAASAADFVLTNLRGADGRLLHCYKDGRARFNAYLDDYACLIDSLVDVYQATFEVRWLDSALELAGIMIAQFHDDETGGFFYTSRDHEKLIARNKDFHDNATPCGNSVAACALLRLGRLCSRADLEEVGERTLAVLSPTMSQHPSAAGQSLIAADFLLGPAHEIILVDGIDNNEGDTVLRDLFRRFLPNAVFARRPSGVQDEDLPAALELLLRGKTAVDGQATVYVCERGSCRQPVVGVDGLDGLR